MTLWDGSRTLLRIIYCRIDVKNTRLSAYAPSKISGLPRCSLLAIWVDAVAAVVVEWRRARYCEFPQLIFGEASCG